MKLNVSIKISAILVVLVLILMNFYAVNFSTSQGSTRLGDNQPYNSFKNYIWGGIGEQENEKYGWNISYIENLNGDEYPDLVMGTPWYDEIPIVDVGAVYIFYGKAGSGFNNLSHSAADVIIIGEIDGDKFGWDVADAGDVNNDGTNDLIVGAPGAKTNRGRAYIFHGGTIPSGTYAAINLTDRILDSEKLGVNAGGYFGSAVAGVGDINKDGYDDVLVGAPSADQALLIYMNINTSTPPLPPGMVSYWKFNEGNGTIAKDSIDTNHGNISGATWVTGISGSALSFDGTDDYVDCGNNSNLDMITNDFTVAVWAKSFGFTSGGTILSKQSWFEGNGPGYFIAYPNNPPNIYVGVYDTKRHIIRTPLESTFDWTHIAMVKEGSQIKAYMNGMATGDGESTTDVTGSLSNTKNLLIGKNEFNNRIFNGLIDEIAIYNRTLTAEEIQQLMGLNNKGSVIIHGAKNSGFGSAITGIGDINGDDYPDMLIGAPNLDGGHVALFHGKEPFKRSESINLAPVILTGKNPGDKFGYSISSVGDVDNDGTKDVIIGAPGGNYAHLYFSSTLNTPLLVPDLWEMNEDKGTPQIEFNSGLKTTGNTPGISGADDGWDVWNGVYESGGTAGSAVKYNGADTTDSAQVAIDDELIVAIGNNLGGGDSSGAKPDSGAYGVKFSVPEEMITAIKFGHEAVISYDWRFENWGLDLDDTIWIKTFLRNDTDDLALGWDLDKYASYNENKDDTNEIHWSDSPEDLKNVFIQECSKCFSKPGYYYLDIGAKVQNYGWEDGVFHFDNVYLRINPSPDIKFIGPAYSGFGYSVGFCEKLNFDDYEDIIIGAPFFDLINGNDSGAIFGFIIRPSFDNLRLGETAEFVVYGEHAGDNLGSSLVGIESIDSDEFSEIVTSAINYDSSLSNIGRIYLLSITKGPRIRLLHPLGGETLSGIIIANAIVTDPDNNIDTSLGVYFYFSTDLIDWTLIGNDLTPAVENNIYEHVWDTTLLPDGNNYYVKSWVQDLKLNKGENISSTVTIDNLHPPQITIKSPKLGSTVEGTMEIKVEAKDSDLDNIGGGINTTSGVWFYFSNDEVTWELLGNDDSSEQDSYTITMDTTVHPDGEYWIKVNTTDLDGFEVEDIINITIDNPGRVSSITLLSPVNVTELSGEVIVSATAFDFDMDINSSGVTFYVSSDTGPVQWQWIGNDSKPEINDTGTHTYSIEWDTTTVSDDWYRLKAFVNDTEGFTNESAVSEFKVHNSVTNPPSIQLISPISGKKLLESQIITAWVRDLEDNIDDHGVDYYYSADKIQWRFIGTTANPRATEKDFYDFLWKTNTVLDGEYWLNISVSDTTNLKSWDVSDEPVLIHNSIMNPPILKILLPTQGQHINGTFPILASAKDMENNIDTVGVVFSYSMDGKDWTILNNVPSAKETGSNFYELSWDTTKHPDGKYWLRAEATDYDGLVGEANSGYFFIHNKLENPPIVTFLGPNSGEVSGIVVLNASVFDLENNLNENGVNFFYSIDNMTWQPIRNDPIGTPMEEETLFYEINWDTTIVSDDIYWLRAEALDLTNLIGADISDDHIIVHNKLDNPPRIIFKQPKKDVPLSQIESIIVEVIDFENDVASVSFYYTRDNKTWELIDTRYKPETGNVYKTMWNTEELYNGKYFIKVIAKDQVGNQEELTEGPFEVKEGKDKSVKTEDELPYWVVIIIAIIIIMGLIIFMILRRSKRREKELMEEVAVEMLEVGKIDDGKIPQLGLERTLDTGITPATETDQTYIPASEEQPVLPEYEPDVETIESYKAQMETWKSEGYNVSRIEEQYSTDEKMFAKTFAILSSNITRLKDISNKLDSIDKTGHENDVTMIKAKLFDPDQAFAVEKEFYDLETRLGLIPTELAGSEPVIGESITPGTPPPGPGTTPELTGIDDILPQLLPTETAPGETTSVSKQEPPADTDAPPDVELPPDIGLPSEAGEAPKPEQEPKPEGEKKEEEK